MKYKINNLVSHSIIKLINFNSNYLGIFKLKDCLYYSKLHNLDLIEIGTKSGFSICKLEKYNRFLYFETKKLKVKSSFNKIQKKKIKKNTKIKEVKFHLFTAVNDYNNKIKVIKKFLDNYLCVKVTLIIKGREILKKNIIKNNIDKIIKIISNFGKFINCSKTLNVNTVFLNFVPKNAKK